MIIEHVEVIIKAISLAWQTGSTIILGGVCTSAL